MRTLKTLGKRPSTNKLDETLEKEKEMMEKRQKILDEQSRKLKFMDTVLKVSSELSNPNREFTNELQQQLNDIQLEFVSLNQEHYDYGTLSERYFLDPSSRNIEYNDDKQVNFASLDKLIQVVTDPENKDTGMLDDFLMTYRNIMTPELLKEKLIWRWNSVPPLEIIFQNEDCETWLQKNLQEIRKNFDFVSGHPEPWIVLKDIISRSVHKDSLVKMVAGDPEPLKLGLSKAPKSLDPRAKSTVHLILNWDPKEIARQLSLMEFDMLRKIEIQECFNQAWIKPNREVVSPNIVAFVNWFNQMSQYYQSLILSGETPQERADHIKFVLMCAEECRKLNNLNGLFEIVSSISSTPILRLKKSWEKLSQSDKDLFAELEKYILPDSNYKLLRSTVTFDAPCIPYPGLILSDLIFIDEGNKTLVDGKVNFRKMRRVASTLSQWSQFKYRPYVFLKVKELRDLIEKISKQALPNDEDLYQKSLKVEPRESSVQVQEEVIEPPSPTWRAALRGLRQSFIQTDLKRVSSRGSIRPETSLVSETTLEPDILESTEGIIVKQPNLTISPVERRKSEESLPPFVQSEPKTLPIPREKVISPLNLTSSPSEKRKSEETLPAITQPVELKRLNSLPTEFPKKENLFLKKNLTIFNYSILNAVGKVEKTPYDPEYVRQKEKAKEILSHYKDVQKTSKLNKGLEDMLDQGNQLVTTLDGYSQKDKPELKLGSEKTDPFSKAEQEFPQFLKATSIKLNSFLEVQKKLEVAYKTFYDGVAALENDCHQLKILKEKYRIQKLDYDQKVFGLNNLKKQKNVEPFKIFQAEQECENAKKEMNPTYVLLCDELEFNRRKRDVDYARLLNELMQANHEYFAQGAKIPLETSIVPDLKLERKKVLTKEELANVVVFGVEFEEIIARDGPVPNLVKILLHHLKKNVGKEGLFRISGEQSMVEKMKRQVDAGDYNLDFSEIHVIAGAFKLFFRSLPTPLFAYKQYQSWIEVSDLDDKNQQLVKVFELFAQIPWSRRNTMGLIFDLLYEISQTPSSKMSPTALAICWGNNLFRSSDPNPSFLMKETGKIQKITELIIVNYLELKQVFDENWILSDRVKSETRVEIKKSRPLPSLPTPTPSKDK